MSLLELLGGQPSRAARNGRNRGIIAEEIILTHERAVAMKLQAQSGSEQIRKL